MGLERIGFDMMGLEKQVQRGWAWIRDFVVDKFREDECRLWREQVGENGFGDWRTMFGEDGSGEVDLQRMCLEKMDLEMMDLLRKWILGM